MTLPVGTSRISPFGLRGENTAKGFLFLFQPSVETGERRDPTDLTKRGNSNVLAALTVQVLGNDTSASTGVDVFEQDKVVNQQNNPCLVRKHLP